MSKPSRTAAASFAANFSIEMHIDRCQMGAITMLLILRWCLENGLITEPESRILTGRAGMLKRYANQGYLIQLQLPPGLKGAPHFGHEHYYKLSEKGMMLLVMRDPDFPEYGLVELRQRTYLHDFIGRIEAAWRVRTCEIVRYVPEIRLAELSSKNKKQHDGHFLCPNGERVGVEIEAFDRKSGDKLARFAAQCMNSVTNDRVQRILILVQTETARCHYSRPFQVGREYCPEWILHKGRWYPKESSKVKISQELSDKVSIEIMLTEDQIMKILVVQPCDFLSAPECFEENWSW